MRYEKESLLSPEFSCWQAVLYSDTGQLPSLLAPQLPGLNREVLPIQASSLSRNGTWVTQCPHGPARLGIYKHCHSRLCISIPHSSRLGRALRGRKQLWSRRALAPIL